MLFRHVMITGRTFRGSVLAGAVTGDISKGPRRTDPERSRGIPGSERFRVFGLPSFARLVHGSNLLTRIPYSTQGKSPAGSLVDRRARLHIVDADVRANALDTSTGRTSAS